MALIVDIRELPLLKLTYVGDFSDGELEAFLTLVTEAIQRPGKKCALIDLRAASNASAKQRKRQAEWIGQHATVLERDISAAAVVTDSALMRGIVTAIFWVRPLPCPTQIEPTLARAEAWLHPYYAQIRRPAR